MPLAPFSPATRAWFEASFGEPTDAQRKGWPAIAAGDHTLLLAPTGSGKTLAAFLWAIDVLATRPAPAPDRRTRVLYLSPLRALAVDIEKNLRAPLTGIQEAATREGATLVHVPEVGVRTGDTDARERRRLLAHPPDILITTPESLYLMLTSSARETLRGVETVIVDEIHAVATSKRGAHLMLSLERLEALTDRPPQRIGLSATQRPLEEIARFLGGYAAPGAPRDVTVVDAGRRKVLDLEVIVPVEDMGAIHVSTEALPRNPALGADLRSIWPSIHPVLLDLIRSHRSTIVFVNERRGAERLASRLNEAAGEVVARAHHGSIAREQRVEVEDALKEGRLPAIVATSSLELGIDMGAVDLVIQVGAPGSVASGIQRIGRAGHHVGAPSVGKLFPKYRGDLLETAVIAERMLSSKIEATAYPRNPLDVLAQQLVAMTAVDAWDVDELFEAVRRAAPFAGCTRAIFDAVLDMLAGRYPSDAFAQLRPRVVWDRARGTVRAREGAGRIAITSGGTIADRGLFGVFTTDGSRVGELDEECVYESRRGEVMLLGATAWRIEEITRDRVVVSHAPGEHGKLPFWKAPGPGRPVELGRAIGRFTRELQGRGRDEAIGTLQRDLRLDPFAARNLVAYVAEQAEAGAVPDDRTVVVERFRDELGDWRVCVLTPLGARVHAPWALAIEARLLARFGPGAQILWSDDGIVVRLPEAVEELPVEEFLFDPETIEDAVIATLPGTALFASVFREAAARALLLPRRRPGTRTPMWQQRQRSADLLAAASAHAQFPILLEATRECVRDHFDVPALAELMADLHARRVRMVSVDTDQASPFARSLLLKWVSVFMYEGDAPLAERRAAALSLDRALLRDLLGSDDLRSLLDADALAGVERELQRLAPGRTARGADGVHDLLRDLGPLQPEQIAARYTGDAAAAIDALETDGRAIRVRVAGQEKVAAVEDAGRLRDGLGVALPDGVPAAFTDPVPDPMRDLVARFARTHGPFRTQDAAASLGVTAGSLLGALEALEAAGTILRGGFRPGGGEDDRCDATVLARIRGRSLAKLRREIEPVDHATFARFLPAWQGADRPRGGAGALGAAIERLEGASIAASILEHDVLPARVQGYRPADLDAMIAAGGLVWVGAGTLGKAGGRIRLLRRDGSGIPDVPTTQGEAGGELHDAIRARLADRGASFWPDLVQATRTADEQAVLAALWDLVWTGEETNDTLAPLRAVLGRSGRRRAPGASRPRPGALRREGPPAGSGRWSLVADMARGDVAPTQRLHALATGLLDRHGIVTRPTVAAEDVPGGFSALYPVFRAMEEGGHVRRGYFVAGSGAAQFASPGAVDRLRGMRAGPDGTWTLAAADPAQPYGASLPWPASSGRPSRSAGAYVVLAAGEPAAFLERGGKTLFTFAEADPGSWVDPIASLVKDGRVQRLEIRTIDAIAASKHPAAGALRSVGFADGYRGLALRG
ncbi:MAG: DEAD/DEAH box helicase [Actinomycetota bacterium]